MTPRQNRAAVLHLLKQETEPVSLDFLMLKLGSGYSERSVRRWLAEMAADGLIEKLGNKRSTKYRIAPERMDSGSRCFSPESERVISRVRRPLYERTPVAYDDEWIDAYLPNKTFYIPKEFRKKLHKMGKRSQQEEPAGTYAHQIFNRLLIDLSYNSSRLEGNTYSLLDTQKLILEGADAEGKLDEEKVMILNHKEAIRYLVDNALKIKVETKVIYTLHYLLSDGLVEARHAGKVRDHGVRIGGSTYIPFEDPKRLQMQLNLIAKKAAAIEDPYEQSFFLLVHITYLQAFSDVNKRTARLCANIPLIRSNVVPQSFNDADKDDYISAVVAIYELQNVRPFLDIYMFSYQRTCAMYDSTVKAIGFDAVRVRYRGQRRSLVREIILNKWTGKKMKKAILDEAIKLIQKDRDAFIEDVFEDLKEMDESRLAGLGITPSQLNSWRKASL